MTTESKVQVAGSLDTPAYRWPLRAGIACCVLSPIALALRRAGRRRWGRFRGIVIILRYLGPVFLLGSGLAGLTFALLIRRILAARRLDVVVEPDGFAMIDRRGRREYADSAVMALGFRSRWDSAVSDSTGRGRASVWVETREGVERLDLAWDHLENGYDPLGHLIRRLADQVHAKAVRAIDSGGVIAGEGWELSRLGLLIGDTFDVLPFDRIAKAEFHDGRLKVWKPGQAGPAFEVSEDSKNVAILHAILIERAPKGRLPDPPDDPSEPGLGLVLFERRATLTDRVGLWLLALILASSLSVLGLVLSRLGQPPVVAIGAVGVGFLGFLPALMRQVRIFRFHERGVVGSGLFGTRELPFEDLDQVRVRAATGASMLKIGFEPIADRGRKRVVLLTGLGDDALESIRSYVPEKLTFG